ncbi:hypothetical protein B0I33_104272 [Prauserella shujinwangii]|uniref:Uncharacterized protein n=1 Tax=Prauserella shujinwangii TaxID=1453103 RepID=A0A2T0LWQ6_9PSEU|nr:hypothetical protein [Prauserella shujinwangii]PRX48456.1 hypothetical protein B0I33_104272 [Prauserella shujinwangii]
MRLVRFPRQPARVSGDIRAALASLGRGQTVIGGIGVLGVRPPGWTRDLDAVLITPRGVVVVVGVDLPDPSIRLEAPLAGQWKADGWPLVHRGEAVNPAIEALELAESLASLVRAEQPDVPIGTVIAVGPFVETIEQPPTDLAGPVRVVYPTATSMLAATVSLASADDPLSATQVRSVLSVVAPDAPEQPDDALRAEGFPVADEEHPLAASAPTVPAPHPARAGTTTTSRPAPAPRPAVPGGPIAAPVSPVPDPRPPVPSARGRAPASRHRRVRWQGVAALALLVLLAVAAIAVAVADGGGEPGDRPPTVVPAGGLDFTERATASDSRCAPHATGDLQVALREHGCVRLHRGSYDTTVDGTLIAVSFAAITFADDATAAEFLAVAETPGSGTVEDLATRTGDWPDPAPTFANAAFAAAADGPTVRLTLSGPLRGAAEPGDAGLAKVARAALELPVPP